MRLNGKQEEIERFLQLLEKQSNVEILNETRFYENSGKTVYKRKYLDVEMKKYRKLDFE
ncbi:DUF3970 family protein [Oceanobacillus oncorhynchi subsp. oncorhynchi]|uniref:DUF3970 family protein n=1 Tax=Oceanobacillus oncorhynchi TaxID=545501 RepID=UPI0036269CB3